MSETINPGDDDGKVSDYFPIDPSTREGALRLKDTIETYWRKHGAEVQIILHNAGFHPTIRATRYELRSDMLNGMPRIKRA